LTENTYYHEGASGPPLQQGDLVLTPIARLELEAGPDDAWKELAPSRYSVPPRDDLAGYGVRTGYAIAMLITHDCHLDREFLRRYEELRKAGKTKDESTREAESDPNLDRFLSVAPLVPLDSFHAEPDAIRRNEVLGLFYVPPREQVGIFEGAVDLTQRSTVERHLVIDRIAVLTEPTRTALRYAVARVDALRTPAIGFELEAAIGKRILSVRPAEQMGGLVVLELSDGSELELVLKPAPVGGGATRTEVPQRVR